MQNWCNQKHLHRRGQGFGSLLNFNTHIYVFDFLELILQVFGQLICAFYRTPLAGQVV